MVSRALERLEALFRIGGGRGANRPGLSAAEQGACDLASDWMAEAGLAVERDPAGNVWGRLPGGRPDLPELWTGSHLDSVPEGGRFDGALGVVAAIEALAVLAAGPRLPRTVAAVAFRDEEGWRFGRGCFGSRALCGRLEPAELDARDAGGTSVREALAALRLAPPPASGWLGRGPAAFVEVHVEQGPVLAEAGAPLGVVTEIVGMTELAVTVEGRAGHAGTTPMEGRSDALCAAAALVLEAREAAERIVGARATVGRLSVVPGAANVIPSRVELTIDVRAPDAVALGRLAASLEESAGRLSAAAGCRAEVRQGERYDPVELAGPVRAALRRSIESTGATPVELPSGAGHDAMVLAAAGVPSGMLFVRSLAGGISHDPAEASAPEDVDAAVHALTAALRDLATPP